MLEVQDSASQAHRDKMGSVFDSAHGCMLHFPVFSLILCEPTYLSSFCHNRDILAFSPREIMEDTNPPPDNALKQCSVGLSEVSWSWWWLH